MKSLLKTFAAPLGLAALLALSMGVAFLPSIPGKAAEAAVIIPAPAIDAAPAEELQTIVLAGGCFWGVQAVFQHTEGVESAVSGYSGGMLRNPSYEMVTTDTTGHAESVEVRFDPKKISYGKILQIFFSVVHNPTQLNYQGPDYGTHYRSAIFYSSDEQKAVAEAYVKQLGEAKAWDEPIVTQIAPMTGFFPAEDYHQDYATLHPEQPYIVWNDLPKIQNMRTTFPEFWRAEPKLVFGKTAS